ncbi:helix-turn-helix domain-containing protein [Desulfoluna butyratoxydans]|uniref:helix-turn-helix domain-containing protein n=1 Tax=Desulfoluna butyratoxydans TaxID=231438 RepID=UPI0015D3D6CC|nr:helix-turn-helix transcriptional regulator [Desulfoluna butyratoxydans]
MLFKDKGISKAEIQRRLRLKSWDTVHKWTKGKYIPKGKNLIQLADILEVSTDYILLGRGDHDNGPFSRYTEIMKLPVKDRAWPIAQAAAEKCGIAGFMSFIEGNGGHEAPTFIQRFLDGEFNEEDFYKEACRVFEEMGNTIKDEFAKRGF